jgi:hypothetical protein
LVYLEIIGRNKRLLERRVQTSDGASIGDHAGGTQSIVEFRYDLRCAQRGGDGATITTLYVGVGVLRKVLELLLGRA